MSGEAESYSIPLPEIKPQEELNPETPLFNQLRYRKKGTQSTYYTSAFEYIDFLAGKPILDRRVHKGAYQPRDPKYIAIYEKLLFQYLSQKRNFEMDLLGFIQHLKNNGFSNLSIRNYTSCAQEILKFNNITISEKTKKQIRDALPYAKVTVERKPVNKKILQEILLNSDARMSALILLLASSGCRIGEAHNIRLVDIHYPDRDIYPEKPVSIFIRESKTGPSRTVYISREAEVALKVWSNVREEYAKTNRKRAMNLPRMRGGLLSKDMLFPWSRHCTESTWAQLVTRAGYGETQSTNKVCRIKMNIHRLRNWFYVQVSAIEGISGPDLANMLMGHKDPYGGAYTGRSVEDIEKAYRKAESALTIGQITFQDEATQKQIVAMSKEMNVLNERLRIIETVSSMFGDLPKDKQDKLKTITP